MATTWVYIVTDGGNLRTVGFYDPAGKWQPDSDHTSEAAAAARVHYLNGGRDPNVAELVSATEALLVAIRQGERVTTIRAGKGYSVTLVDSNIGPVEAALAKAKETP